jgi:hypothetical protein
MFGNSKAGKRLDKVWPVNPGQIYEIVRLRHSPGFFAKRRLPRASMRIPTTRGLRTEKRCADPRAFECCVSRR